MATTPHILTFPASDAEKVQLGGESEQNFVRVENALGVRLITRNAGVTVQAPDETTAQRAVATLVKMRETLKTGQHLSEFYVDELLHLTGGKPGTGTETKATDAKPSDGKPFVPSQEKPVLIDRYGKPVQPKTRGQARFLQIIREHDIVFAAGPAGTGKTFMAVAMAVQALEKKIVDRVILCRPAVESGESLGFLPGVISEKIAPYMRPLHDSLSVMLPTERLREYWDGNSIEIAPLAYMRGRTLSRSFVILDEAQNTTVAQMKMFLTRLGPGTRAVLTGDESQVDLGIREKSGFSHARRILAGIEGIGQIELGLEDVVRHRLVREIIRAYETNGVRE
jgi:phosphate starvation-inducible protein PhoH and related proteins